MVMHDPRQMSHAVPSAPSLSQPTLGSSPTKALNPSAFSQAALPTPIPGFLPCDRVGTHQTS